MFAQDAGLKKRCPATSSHFFVEKLACFKEFFLSFRLLQYYITALLSQSQSPPQNPLGLSSIRAWGRPSLADTAPSSVAHQISYQDLKSVRDIRLNIAGFVC